MASKIMKLSFPIEDSDVYALLTTKSKPSKFVVEAVRFYQANKNARKQQQDMNKNIELIVRTIIKEELLKSSSSIKSIVDRTLEEALKDMSLQQVSATSVEVVTPSEIGKANISLLEDTNGFDFSNAISAFSDDD